MKKSFIKRSFKLSLTGVSAVAFALMAFGTGVAQASPLSDAEASISCPANSVVAGRYWDGSGYAAFGSGFPGLRAIAPSAVKITVSKPFEIEPGSGFYTQTVQVGTKNTTTLKGYAIKPVGSAGFTGGPSGYLESTVLGEGTPTRSISAVAVCVANGGAGEAENPPGGFLPIPPSAIY